MLGYESSYGDDFGVFIVPYKPTHVKLRCIVASARLSGEDGPEWAWDHVSVSLPARCPNWAEMSFMKEMFFSDDKTVMQLHVPKAQHLNLHPYTLHLWRPANLVIPMPPSDAVAVAGGIEANRRYFERERG
jgi:hypothetical protein